MGKTGIGKKVPDFRLPATGDREIALSDYAGKNVVVYFYPKDSTPGCTTEGQDFRDKIHTFRRRNTVILGISRDSVKSHENFKAKQQFPFDLLSDADETACRLFDVIREKNMYGRKVMGIERSTFLIDDQGILRREWRKVAVKGHVDEVSGTRSAGLSLAAQQLGQPGGKCRKPQQHEQEQPGIRLPCSRSRLLIAQQRPVKCQADARLAGQTRNHPAVGIGNRAVRHFRRVMGTGQQLARLGGSARHGHRQTHCRQQQYCRQ